MQPADEDPDLDGTLLQGIGAAAVMPLSLTLLSQAVPERLRGMALGVWSGVSGLAVAMGPVASNLTVRACSSLPAASCERKWTKVALSSESWIAICWSAS